MIVSAAIQSPVGRKALRSLSLQLENVFFFRFFVIRQQRPRGDQVVFEQRKTWTKVQ